MSSATRRGGIPGPESRTGLIRPSDDRGRVRAPAQAAAAAAEPQPPAATAERARPRPRRRPRRAVGPGRSTASTRAARTPRSKPAKPRRVQRMFAIEEDVDKKLWLYAIHVGKDRSEVVNDLLRPLVASMVLYDSRDRRGARTAELAGERRRGDGDGDLPELNGRQGAGHIRPTQSSGKSRVWLRADTFLAGAALRARARQSGSSIFFQRLRPGFSALTVGEDRLALESGRAAPRRRRSLASRDSVARRASASGLRLAGLASALARLACSRASLAATSARRLVIAGGLVVGPDRGDEVAGRVLADPLVLVA